MISQIKQVSLDLLSIINELANEEIRYGTIRSFWNRFFVPRATRIIMNKNDIELKQKLDGAYQKIKPIYEQKEMSVNLTQGLKLGSPKPPMLGDMRKLLELELDEIL